MKNTHPSFAPSNDYLPIEDYALIGDLHTVALVGKNGSSSPKGIWAGGLPISCFPTREKCYFAYLLK
ncbi:hypothetical protein KSB_85570 [Ktedonobacter robiniae]|uniref:Uncharacterized protein n=1 Tax=Ktedonobacter robiniae TaxID=2778365 RepID=A0ABQ3V543_9CHLR|nr:hypothetical protein KSB_85570 [Ktedonobacter robiniae]